MEEPIRVHLTYADYLACPEDGQRYEIIEGELAVSPSPTTRHQGVSGDLHLLLASWVAAGAGGKLYYARLTVYLADDSVVEPDLLWIAPDRVAQVVGDIIHGAPDLVIEIASPSTRSRDRGAKLRLYAKYGVREYWLVDPAGPDVEILALEGGAFRTHAAGSGAAALASRLDPRLVVVPERLGR